MTARTLLDALRLRALAFTAALAGLSVAMVASLALLFAPIPGAASFRAPLDRTPHTAPSLARGPSAGPSASHAELRADRPTARSAARSSADRGPRPQLGGPLPDVAPAALRAEPLKAVVADLDGAAAPSASVARVECLRSAIVCSPRETRAPPLG